MQFDGMPVEKWRAQFTGAIEIDEREGTAMRTDRVVVMVVATRIRKSVPEPLDEDGTMRITRQNKIEHLAVLEGDLREKALTLLATGNERGFQDTLELTPPAVDPETGEIITAGYASVVTPPAPAALLEPDEDLAFAEDAVATFEPELDDDHYGLSVAVDSEGTMTVDGRVHADDQPEYFDVPPIKDTSQPVGTGPVKKHGPVNNGGGGDGFKVAPVSTDDLAAVGAGSVPSADPAAPPMGEVVGNVRPHGRSDKALEDFFNEEIPQ